MSNGVNVGHSSWIITICCVEFVIIVASNELKGAWQLLLMMRNPHVLTFHTFIWYLVTFQFANFTFGFLYLHSCNRYKYFNFCHSIPWIFCWKSAYYVSSYIRICYLPQNHKLPFQRIFKSHLVDKNSHSIQVSVASVLCFKSRGKAFIFFSTFLVGIFLFNLCIFVL